MLMNMTTEDLRLKIETDESEKDNWLAAGIRIIMFLLDSI